MYFLGGFRWSRIYGDGQMVAFQESLWMNFPVLSFFVVSLTLAVVLLLCTTLLTFETKIDLEKSSVYECGFNPFSESRYRFDVKFCVVSILFVIFDVEILYFFPFALTLPSLPFQAGALFLIFVLILFLGIIYEISRSLLDFEEN